MGLVRDYLKYEKGPILNVIAGPKGNILFKDNGSSCLVPSSEDVISYNLKTQERENIFYGEKSEVTFLAPSFNGQNFAVGYKDGSIQIFNFEEQESILAFHGHKSRITTLCYDERGHRLVSGSQDTNLVLWDLITESGMFKLKGHKGNITKCSFLVCDVHDILLSSSKDGTIKFWDLNLQHCFKTFIENGIEIYDFVIIKGYLAEQTNVNNLKTDETLSDAKNINSSRLISISSDNFLRMWDLRINVNAQPFLSVPSYENFISNTFSFCNLALKADETVNKKNFCTDNFDTLITTTFLGKLARNTKFHGTTLIKDQTDSYLGCHGNDNILNVYRILPEYKLNKIYKKKQKSILSSAVAFNNVDNTMEENWTENKICSRSIEHEIIPFETNFNNLGGGTSTVIIIDDCKIKSCDFFSYSSSSHREIADICDISTSSKAVAIVNLDNFLHTGRKGRKKMKKTLKKLSGKEESNRILKVCIMRSDNKIAVYEPIRPSFPNKSKNLPLTNRENELMFEKLTEYWHLTRLLECQGHATDVRSLALSWDSQSILSTSAESVKIWNRMNQRCLKTMPCEYGLCSIFLPADKYALVGSKTGKLHLYDVQTGDLVENIEAHEGPVWALALHPNQESVITGGGGSDRTVKFWDIKMADTLKTHRLVPMDRGFVNYNELGDFNGCNEGDVETNIVKRFTFIHSKSLHFENDILCLKPSPDQKFLAVGLLDNTIKIFFLDTLKFYLSLYGHSMPVTCLDISPTDSSLIVTGSQDKLIKIWGLKFGDCHKTLRGHSDTVTCIGFVPLSGLSQIGGESLERDLHLFFSAAKDGLIIQWDAVKFEKILVLKGHHAEIWALNSSCSDFLITASHDKSIRFWYKTDEILNIHEENDREAQESSEIMTLENLPISNIFGPISQELGLACSRSIETLDATEKLIQALDYYTKRVTTYLPENPIKMSSRKRSADTLSENGDDEGFQDGVVIGTAGKTLREIMLERENLGNFFPVVSTKKKYPHEHFTIETCLKNIKFSELQYATLLLPRAYVDTLISLLRSYLIGQSSTRDFLLGHVEICVKLLCFLFKSHLGTRNWMSSVFPEPFRGTILDCGDNLSQLVSRYRDFVGFNKTVLFYLHQQTKKNNIV